MKPRFRLFCRKKGKFYAFDKLTGKRESLETDDRHEAMRLLHAKNEAQHQPALNLQIARAYLMASDPLVGQRTWQHVMDEAGKTKSGPTKARWDRAMREGHLDPIRNKTILETQAEHFISILRAGTICTNIFLRRLHNFALDMNWLPAAIIPRRQWPGISFKEKRAITLEEHKKILAIEGNPERQRFYELLWSLGGSQTDVANLQAEDIDW